MFTRDGLKAFHRWTHDSLDVLLRHASTMPAALLIKEVPGFARPDIRAQLVHILRCEAAWVRGLQHLPLEPWPPDFFPTVESLVEARRRVEAGTLAYLDSLSETELNTRLEQVPDDWVGPRQSPAFIVHHVLTHAFHHKGQVVAMCRILGQPAPDTDMQREAV